MFALPAPQGLKILFACNDQNLITPNGDGYTLRVQQKMWGRISAGGGGISLERSTADHFLLWSAAFRIGRILKKTTPFVPRPRVYHVPTFFARFAEHGSEGLPGIPWLAKLRLPVMFLIAQSFTAGSTCS